MIEFFASCEEKGGTVVRRVYELDRSPGNLLQVVENLKRVDSFIDGVSPTVLLDEGMEVMQVDDVGLVALDKRNARDARVHMTFWDRRLRGREYLCRRVAGYWIDKYNLEYLSTSIPVTAGMVIAFARKVGFKSFTESEGYVHLVLTFHNYLHCANRQIEEI